MAKLILLRHLKSQWNEENRFTGWMDVPLDKDEAGRAKELADSVFRFNIDIVYTSPLFRNQDTVARMFAAGGVKYPVFSHLDGGKMQKRGHFVDISEDDAPVFVSEKLNERYYGKLQGEDKAAAMEKYGKDRVHLWRRSYLEAPPGGESLKDVAKRTIPFFLKYIEKDLKIGRNVLVVASHNSLRAVVKYVENISDEEIINLEIPYGGLRAYDFEKGVYRKITS